MRRIIIGAVVDAVFVAGLIVFPSPVVRGLAMGLWLPFFYLSML